MTERVQADAVDAVLTASRALIAVATTSLGAAAEETTTARYRSLVLRWRGGEEGKCDEH